MSTVLTDLRGNTLVVTLNRPERLNAISPKMELDYLETMRSADADPGVRVIVVTGAGRAFCSGADISMTTTELAVNGAPLPPRNESHFPPTMRTPVIAAINGACAGLGLAVALQADVRFVSDSAKLTTAFTRRGLIAEHGIAWLLPRLVGRGRAMDLLLSGRTFNGVDAHSFGLAEFCVPSAEVLAAAMDYADDIAANCSPTAMGVVKTQLRESAEDPYQALLGADAHTRASFTWPDFHEGILAWQERRPPQFPGLHES